MNNNIHPFPDSPQERFLKSPMHKTGYRGAGGILRGEHWAIALLLEQQTEDKPISEDESRQPRKNE